MDSDASLAVRELAFLQRLARAAASEQDPGQLLSLIIRETTSATNTDVASLYLVSEDGSQLLLTATVIRGPGFLGEVTFIQRLNTTGGVAPAGSCTEGVTASVPYTADYAFWVKQ